MKHFRNYFYCYLIRPYEAVFLDIIKEFQELKRSMIIDKIESPHMNFLNIIFIFCDLSFFSEQGYTVPTS